MNWKFWKRSKKAEPQERRDPITNAIAEAQVSIDANGFPYIDPDLVLRTGSKGRVSRSVAQTVFKAAPPPPGLPKEAALAMDSNITAYNGWIAQYGSVMGSFWSEGLTFMGYPYLAELAQRPEYRMIAEIIPSEMTRKWIRFTTKDAEADGKRVDKSDRINQLKAEFERLNVREIFCRAAEQDGFFGRGHIYIDTGDTDDPEELLSSLGTGWDEVSKSKISTKRPIKALRTIEAVWCYPVQYESFNPLKPDWFTPQVWYVQANQVHASRLMTLIGREVPDLLKPVYAFGGLSMTQMAKPYVDNWLETRQSVNQIIRSFVTYVLSSDMGTLIQKGGEQLLARVQMFNNLRTNAGTMVIDKNTEDFKNIVTPLSGLHELQAQSQEQMASVSHVPIVKLLGIQPAGLNADSEGVMRSFYDYVGASQEHLFRRPLHALMGMIMLSLWDEVDDQIGFEFEPLWTLDEKGMAEVNKIKSENDMILIDGGIISPEEARARVANDEDSGYDSLDPEAMPDPFPAGEEGAPGTEGEGGEYIDPMTENDLESEALQDEVMRVAAE